MTAGSLEPMTTTENKTTAELQLDGRDDHNIPAGDLMNISTVADPTDIDIKVPRFHQGQWKDSKATVYLLMTHEEPRNPMWTKRIEATPISSYDHLTPVRAAELREPGFVWGDDEDDPEERKGEFVFTSLGLHEFVGYEIDTAATSQYQAFTGIFRKIEVTR